MTPKLRSEESETLLRFDGFASRIILARSRFSERPNDSSIIDEFTERWDLGESPKIEEFLDRIDPPSSKLAVELIYRQYCLEEARGDSPSSENYLNQFASYREELGRLFQVHDAITCSQIHRWAKPKCGDKSDEPLMLDLELPRAGDQVGPFLLLRVLGEGASARVFLAEQSDLGQRLVVVKVSASPSREPWLLARARHAYIVDIISQYEVDDGLLQLICMPFRGGATLSRILEETKRSAKPPRTGREFLHVLDAVAAPEFPQDQQSKTTRDLLSRTSAVRSMAWMIARLAEALDYAFAKNVAHGDVKPSNILISADGNPMLLDFNLAQDWDEGGDQSHIDRGGTLAYMAPERLLSLAQKDGLDSSKPHPICPHCADIYSLGMVFLEMISKLGAGNPWGIEPKPSNQAKPRKDFRKTCEVLARERLALAPLALIDRVAGKRIQVGLRTILAKCLDPDPARRYQRGRDLATDLDRWQADRPLIFADEPVVHAAVRKLYRARRVLVSVGVVLLAAGTVGHGVSWILNRYKGIEKLASIWDSKETRAFGNLRIPYAGERGELSIRPIGVANESQSSGLFVHRTKALSKSIEIASLALNDYQVLGPTNWREREDFRTLPQGEREDLELWLMEQAYRYLHDLAEHPDSPEDWERALTALNRVLATTPLTPFARLASRLEQQLFEVSRRLDGLGKPHSQPLRIAVNTGENSAAAFHLEQYILGVANECDSESSDSSLLMSWNDRAGSIDERILSYYQTALEHRPNSFWAHYRASAACGRLGMSLDRTAHLQACLKLRPANPAIHGLLSSSLLVQNRLGDALSESERAIELDPDHAEYHRTKAFIDANLGRSEQVRHDIHRYEVLSRIIPAELLRTHFRLNSSVSTTGPETLRLDIDHSRAIADVTPSYDRSLGHQIACEPEEVDTRFNQALTILRKVRDTQIVITELGKILLINPNYHHARILRAGLLVESRNFEEGRQDLKRILNHPQLNEFIFEKPDVLGRFIDIAWAYMRQGKNDEALDFSQNLLSLPDPLKNHIGRLYYTLARAEAAISSKDPGMLLPVVDHLSVAFGRNPHFRDWYKQDPVFESMRGKVDEAIRSGKKSDGKSSPLQTALSRTDKELDD